MIRVNHIHRMLAKLSITEPFTESVAHMDVSANPAAHGGICKIDRCLCGAVRKTNINGVHSETSGWEGGDPDYQDKRNPAAVALGQKRSPIKDEARKAEIRANAAKPRGLRAERVEKLKEVVQDGIATIDGIELPVQRHLYRAETVGARRVSWSVRWYAGVELIKIIVSIKKPVLDKPDPLQSWNKNSAKS